MNHVTKHMMFGIQADGQRITVCNKTWLQLYPTAAMGIDHKDIIKLIDIELDHLTSMREQLIHWQPGDIIE